MRKQFSAAALALSVVALVGLEGGAPAPAQAAVVDRLPFIEKVCERTVGRPPGDFLLKATEPAPGTPVAPGDTIKVRLSWDRARWADDVLHKVLDCVTVNGEHSGPLSVEEKPTDNDGVFETTVTVPPDLKAGDEICDQGFISGGRRGGDQENSAEICFPVKDGPPVPEAAPPRQVASGPAPRPAPPPALVLPSAEAPAPAPVSLPLTGSGRSLLLTAAAALLFGGGAIAAGARRRQPAAD